MPIPALARWSALLAAMVSVGCSSKTPTVPNPFDTADRVPPPTLRTGPYYDPNAASAPAFLPGPTAPSGYPTAPTYAPSAAPPGPGQATPYYGPPGGTSAVERPPVAAVAAGDEISVQPDSGALRFASRSAEDSPSRVAASGPPPRRAATANAWIAGSAPVTPTPHASPRVRLPGQTHPSEPVSLAAIQQQGAVPIAPLEPAPTGGGAGQAGPLRVASPPSTTGWY